MFLNLIFQKYGKLPKDYQIVGFDDSPIASEAILPITTVGQQIEKIAQTAMELLVLQMNEMKKRKPAPLKEPPQRNCQRRPTFLSIHFSVPIYVSSSDIKTVAYTPYGFYVPLIFSIYLITHTLNMYRNGRHITYCVHTPYSIK